MAYSVRLNNGERVRVVVYVVSDDPKAVVVPGAPIEQRYQWNSVTRSQCKKGCSGPILRAIQRFGRQGRCASPATPCCALCCVTGFTACFCRDLLLYGLTRARSCINGCAKSSL